MKGSKPISLRMQLLPGKRMTAPDLRKPNDGDIASLSCLELQV